MYDILIKGGSYPDFEKQQMVQGDVAISDGKIVALGRVDGEAKRVIEADGRVVSPGFIDIHMHEENFVTEGEEYGIAKLMLQMGVTTCLGGNCGTAHQSLQLFKDTIEKLGGAPVNYLMLAGYNTAREDMGISRYDAASAEQIRTLTQQMTADIENGAFGISFGLEYDPGITYDEVVEVIKAQPQEDLFVSMHYRDDSTGSPESVTEMIHIAEETGKKFQISHLSSCSAMGQMEGVLAEIKKAMEANPKLDYDTYPYNAFSTRIGTAVFDDGCFEKWNKSYDSILLTSGPHKNQFCDKELFEQVRREDPDQYVVAFVMNEDEIAAAIANPNGGMVASDGIISRGSGHPRAAGTFPRVLGKYVREGKCLSLYDALRKMTFEPARRLDLSGKGKIAVGCDADITVFDPETIADGANFETLFIKPTGIDAVIVGGTVALWESNIVNERAGRFINSPFYRKK